MENEATMNDKPGITNERFVIVQANAALKTLVEYEAQYKNSVPADIQKRILDLTDFIKARLEQLSPDS